MSVKIRKYDKVAVGGTFDKFHKGHKTLIKKALDVGKTVLIGITTEQMLKNYPKNHVVDRFSDRVKELKTFLEEIKVMSKIVTIPIDDPYGPTITDESIDLLVVSLETAFRAREINQLRKVRGLKPLKIMVINMVLAEDRQPISTNRIRREEIDREGRLLTSRS